MLGAGSAFRVPLTKLDGANEGLGLAKGLEGAFPGLPKLDDPCCVLEEFEDIVTIGFGNPGPDAGAAWFMCRANGFVGWPNVEGFDGWPNVDVFDGWPNLD